MLLVKFNKDATVVLKEVVSHLEKIEKETGRTVDLMLPISVTVHHGQMSSEMDNLCSPKQIVVSPENPIRLGHMRFIGDNADTYRFYPEGVYNSQTDVDNLVRENETLACQMDYFEDNDGEQYATITGFFIMPKKGLDYDKIVDTFVAAKDCGEE